MSLRVLAPFCALALATLSIAASGAAPAVNPAPYIVDHSHSPHAVLRPVSYDAVTWTQGFWAERYRQLEEVTLPESWRLMADPAAGHVLENFRIAAGRAEGKYAGTSWQDEWLYKWIEAAACVYRKTNSSALNQQMDEAIELIAAAQQPDGYLSTKPIVTRKPRYQDSNEHEVYNMGHLLTAGVIHRRMTGKDSLLKVALRAADHLSATLGVTVNPSMAHNPSAVMGLVECYRLTGDRKYLACAERIIDQRGSQPKKQPFMAMQPGVEGTDNIQDRVPVRLSNEVVGHNVFFTYLYTGAGDVLAENGDDRLAAALARLWTDATERKMFINGGVSAVSKGVSNNAPVIEAAGAPYFLPNETCYNETCGQIGMLMWGYRMLTYKPDARLADTMEREMYNGFLGATSLDGKAWFYRNVLRRYESERRVAEATDMLDRRSPGLNAICCPSNLLRTIAQLSAYMYSVDDKGLWVHHYGGNRLDTEIAAGHRLQLEQVTDYPWSGTVRIDVGEAPSRPLALRLRIPGWAGSQPTVAVNGQPPGQLVIENGYAVIERLWKRGDSIVLELPMKSQLVAGNPRIEETRNQVAVMRGPILYCLESPDLPAGRELPQVYLPTNIRLETKLGLSGASGDLATHSMVLEGEALYLPEPAWAGLYRPLDRRTFETLPLRLVPYYAWANRGRSKMSVWLPLVDRD